MSKLMRLDRLLSNRGYATRRSLRDELGFVTVNGQPAKRVDDKVDPATVCWDGEPIDPEKVYLLMNKPAGYTCSHSDDGDLVYDLLPPRYPVRNPAIASVGRLDKDTTGALLFTDDGEMLHRVTSPKHKVPKLYECWLIDPLTEYDVDYLCSGEIMLDDVPVRPAKLEVLEPNHVLMTLVEGRYHQVKRMFLEAGNEVLRLHRREFAGLNVLDVPEGGWRHLTLEEVAQLAR
jgi:16S rRNA pseudouridine516 synthase